jgi:hypothetical protein
MSRGQKVRTRKHKGVLLSASIESSKMEQIRPRVFEEDSFSPHTTAGPSRAKLGVAIIFLSFAFVASLWLVYTSVGAMLSGSNVVGLFGISDPTLTYRIGLVLAALSCFTIAVIAAINITR